MECVQWNEDYSLGIKEIDEQHQKLVGIMNKLCDSLNEGKEKEAIEDILSEMVSYAVSHFMLEENYFHQFHYEKAEEHEAQHQEFRDKVQALQKDLSEGKGTVTTDALTYLGDWFIKHVLDQDRQYVELFHEHGRSPPNSPPMKDC